MFKFFLAICKNIFQRKLFIWYHRYQNNSFLGWWILVFGNSIIPYPVRSYLFLGNKKCRIYAACGVSQTPINAYLKKGDENLGQLGYTDHFQAHCVQVARQAGKILERFGYSDHEIELVKIAGYMHDIGNAINRTHHAEYGALLANSLLKEMDMPLDDRITIMSAIGNHDESTGGPEDVISAALIIADKTDVRRSRVREKERAAFDIHDRVNYAVTESKLKIEKDRSVITLNLQVDEKICSMYDYFEIFLGRMMLCRKSAEILGTTFKLTVNGRKVL